MFARLLGNPRVREILRRMAAERRVPGALIFAGPAGVGKKLFAIETAKALNCRTPVEGQACDQCLSCRRIGRLAQSTAPEPAEADGQLLWGEHRDVGLVRAPKRLILVEQIRELEREANFRPFEGTARVFIIDDADKLNDSSSNALLKTLEEPPSTTHLILITARPASLLPTIRSRCQIIRFAPLSLAEIETHLTDRRRLGAAEARLAARVAHGRLGRALELDINAYRGQRETMLGVVGALTAVGGDRGRLLRAAEEISDTKRKEEYEPHLDVLETLMRDVWLLTLGIHDAEIVNEDLRDRLARISSGVDSRRVRTWLSRLEELRGQLAVNINRRVATDALFLAMAAEEGAGNPARPPGA